MDWQEVDMILRLTPKHTLVNLGELTSHDLYHMDHGHPREPWSASRNRKTNPVRDLDHRPEKFYPNGKSWGLLRYPLEVLAAFPDHGDGNTRTLNNWQYNWLPFILLLLLTGAQIVWDGLIISLKSVLRKLLNFVFSVLPPRCKHRAQIVRGVFYGQPLRSWPGLLMCLVERQFHQRQ
jgi:hypothetical protein